MSSKDPISKKANAWLSGKERPSEITRPEHGATASRTERRAMSAQVQRLARRLGSDPDKLAESIPADTLRRTQYPVLETVNEDGTRSFKHDSGIQEARTALIQK